MMTTTHVLLGAALATRPTMKPWAITLGWLGGFAPDASVFLMVAVARMSPLVPANLWRQPDGLYWQEPWQTLSAISNSIPMWALVALAGFVLLKSTNWKALGLGLLVFGTAALLHVVLDFPVHTDDAHVHFWPFTDWRFHSAVSYYRSSEYGNIMRPVDIGLGVLAGAYLIWRFKQWPVRIFAFLLAVFPLVGRGLIRLFF